MLTKPGEDGQAAILRRAKHADEKLKLLVADRRISGLRRARLIFADVADVVVDVEESASRLVNAG